MNDDPTWAPDDVDPTVPSMARVYDYFLGGSHNFAADRELAEATIRAMPDLRRISRENRHFLRRVVGNLSAAGIDQFLDLGSGIPTVGSVHEVTRAVNPAARVVYVDRDPVAVTHSRELLDGDDHTLVLPADLREPDLLLGRPELREFLDLDRPVAVLLFFALHYVLEDELSASELLGGYLRQLGPGSHLAISHVTHSPDVHGAVAELRRTASRDQGQSRSVAEVTALFDGLTLLDPGVVRVPLWRPDDVRDVPADVESMPVFGGVGRLE